MTDVLTIPSPDYCTAQRFNLWVGMNVRIEAPIIGIPLRDACKGTPVNPFVLGCIAIVFSRRFTDAEALARNDVFGMGGAYESHHEACAHAAKAAMMAGSLDMYPGMTPDHAAQIRGLYAQYARFAKRMSGDPIIPAPAPVPAPAPTPVPVPPVVKQPPVPVPPAPAPVLAKPKWKKTVGIVVGALSALLAVGAWFLPGHIEAPLRALLAMLKALLAG